MAEPQPIVCAYLKLPPEQQTFFRMREIPLTFLEKLDRLSLVLAASHDEHPCPAAIQIMRDLRRSAGEQCDQLSVVMYYGHRFATIYLELLHALPPASAWKETLLKVHRVNTHAILAAREMGETQKGMVKFKQDITDAVRRITTALNDNKRTDDTVFTAENSQVVTEFLHAVDECNRLLLQSGDYYRAIEQQTKDEESIKSSQPSDEEAEMMRDRWTTFSASVAGLRDGFGALHNMVLRGGDIQKVDGSYHNARTPGDTAPSGSPDPTDGQNGRKAIVDAVSGPSPSTKPKASLWRSSLHRLFSCFTTKQFS